MGEGMREGRRGEMEFTCSWKDLMPVTEKSLHAFTKASAIGRNELLPKNYFLVFVKREESRGDKREKVR